MNPKIFLMWSEDASRRVADELHKLLEAVVQGPEYFISTRGIAAGELWDHVIGGELEATNLGIACMTPGALQSPWIHFEAGAISKASRTSRVIPYLVGVRETELTGPLTRFQSVSATEDGTRSLVSSLLSACNWSNREAAVHRALEAFWPMFERTINEVTSAPRNLGSAPDALNSLHRRVLRLEDALEHKDVRVPTQHIEEELSQIVTKALKATRANGPPTSTNHSPSESELLAEVVQILRERFGLRPIRDEEGRREFPEPDSSRETDVQEPSLERLLGVDRYRTFNWYRTGLDRAASVAKVVDKDGNAHGTGFLLRASDVHKNIASEWVFVTSAHVMSSDLVEQRQMPAALSPDEVRVKFEASDSPNEEFFVKEVLFTSPRDQLDCSIAVLSGQVQPHRPIPIAKRLPLLGKNQRVFVIGHPRGGRLAYSIDDNLLLDHERSKVHYRAPTEGGSAGSPVFNAAWDLIALHHAGSPAMKKLNGTPGVYAANEGIAIRAILAAVAEQFG